ncbi:hypothetical protein C2U51_15245 [Enterobacteriaceae bacterium ENNIH1]|nr:hypothetical protein C2U51_15245 [Enterobacteriaceae bacterium ENNIH1]
MSRLTAIICAAIILLIAALAWSALHSSQKAADAESESRVLRSDNALQGQVIASQVFNINRFNQTAQTAARANAITASGSETTVIKYREILHREKTCDLPVPADIAGGLLDYANRLRASAMHPNTSVADPANGGAIAASGMTYCQAVLWIAPLLATLEQGNNNFAAIREIEQLRAQQTKETP